MRDGRNPTRRNRNIGTAKSGHGQNNELVIPTRIHPEWIPYHEHLKNYICVKREINGQKFIFFVEKVRKGYIHACTIDDIEHVLSFVPKDDLEGIELIILRQPKQKEEIISLVWGRLVFYAEIGNHSGRAIVIESVQRKKSMRWTKSLSVDAMEELKRLISDGHKVETTKKYYVLHSSLEAVRATQLYRTLLHEIGHHVDYKKNEDIFDRKPSQQKEVFAHRYAEKLGNEMKKKKIIPFERIGTKESIELGGLRISDFFYQDDEE